MVYMRHIFTRSNSVCLVGFAFIDNLYFLNSFYLEHLIYFNTNVGKRSLDLSSLQM